MGQLSQIVTPYRAPSESTMGKSVPFGQNSFFFQFSELTKKEMRTGTKFTPKQLNAFDHHVFSSIALLLTVSQAAFLLESQVDAPSISREYWSTVPIEHIIQISQSL